MTVPVPAVSLREQALGSLGKLPPFPPILNRLLASLAQENVSLSKIAELIEKDTVLAGNVLKLVNSALYGRSATVNSVRHAVSLLGVNKLRNATLGMSVTRMWSQVRTPQAWSMARFNLHSVATAILADIISQAAPVEYAEGAFAAGLFHDLGRLLIAIGLPEEHEQVNRLCAGSVVSRSEWELEILGFTNTDLAADALARWNLPEEIRAAVRFQHAPESPGGGKISLAEVIQASNAYINALGHGIAPAKAIAPDVIDQATAGIAKLGIGARLPAVLESFSSEFGFVGILL